MFKSLEVMRMSQGMAQHAAARQDVVARNMANADTPGYRAQDVPEFAEIYRARAETGGMRTTRAGHLGTAEQGPQRPAALDAGGPAAPNGNTVSLETEMVRAIDARRSHDRALAIYGAGLDMLRTAIGRG